MIKDWTERSLPMKILTVIGLIASVSVMILAVLQLAGVWEQAAYAYEPLVGVAMLVQAAENRKKNRGVACLSLIAAIVVFAATIVVLLA